MPTKFEFLNKKRNILLFFHCDKEQIKEVLTVIHDEDAYINKLFPQKNCVSRK